MQTYIVQNIETIETITTFQSTEEFDLWMEQHEYDYGLVDLCEDPDKEYDLVAFVAPFDHVEEPIKDLHRKQKEITLQDIHEIVPSIGDVVFAVPEYFRGNIFECFDKETGKLLQGHLFYVQSIKEHCLTHNKDGSISYYFGDIVLWDGQDTFHEVILEYSCGCKYSCPSMAFSIDRYGKRKLWTMMDLKRLEVIL